MILPEFTYLAPESVQEACMLLGRYRGEAKLLAGGSDLIVKMKSGIVKPGYVVSLKGIAGLSGVRHEAGVGVVIGALTTHNQLAASPVMREHYPSVSSAASGMAGYQIRNIGTIGGNLVNAVPSADLPPILLALEARVRMVGVGGMREVPLEEFFLGPGTTVLGEDEVLTEVLIPEQGTSGSHYIKFGLRKAEALAVVGVAAGVEMDGGVIRDVRIALGAVAPVPMRAREAEGVLRGKRVSEDLLLEAGRLAAEASRPITDIRGSSEYRRHLVGVLTRDCLRVAIEKGHI